MTSVVILPGLDGTSALLADFIASLARLGVPARPIAYPADRVMDYESLEPLVRSQLPADGDFILLGESFSGPLAIRIAARPPRGLRGIVLSTTFARSPVPSLRALAPLVRFAPARPPLALLSWYLFGAWATPALKTALAAALRPVDPAVLRARARAALMVDASPHLPQVNAPVLLLVANQDRLLASSARRALIDGLPASEVVGLDGPHLLLQAEPEACARHVADFVRRIVV